MKCLLVDDEPGIREGLAMLLRRRGYEVGTAADCGQARDRLAETRFDVVVTDWRLPDGLASSFVDCARCPVIAVSGHPEEVVPGASIALVLAKPIMPTQLLERIASLVDNDSVDNHPVDNRSVDGDTATVPDPRLPSDVQSVIDDVLAQLPADTVVEGQDDGTFVVLRCRLPAEHVPRVRHLGGDLQQRVDGQARWLELRLCRDGRPDTDVPVVRIDTTWPDHARLALDCDGIEEPAAAFERRLARVQDRIRAGDAVWLLNVPEHLDAITTVWETTHDMPMRARVGPRLPAELAELWS